MLMMMNLFYDSYCWAMPGCHAPLSKYLNTYCSATFCSYYPYICKHVTKDIDTYVLLPDCSVIPSMYVY